MIAEVASRVLTMMISKPRLTLKIERMLLGVVG